MLREPEKRDSLNLSMTRAAAALDPNSKKAEQSLPALTSLTSRGLASPLPVMAFLMLAIVTESLSLSTWIMFELSLMLELSQRFSF